jgi:hypothetical protein
MPKNLWGEWIPEPLPGGAMGGKALPEKDTTFQPDGSDLGYIAVTAFTVRSDSEVVDILPLGARDLSSIEHVSPEVAAVALIGGARLVR